MRAQGIDVVSLGAGEPDFDTPDHIKAAAAEALGGGETKYAKPASGVPELKQAVVAKLQRENGLTYTTDQVVASVGGKEALYLAFATLLDPGDEVIIPAPYWVSYPEQVKLAGGVPVFVDAGADAGFRITPDQLRDALSPRTRVLVFNSPSNPHRRRLFPRGNRRPGGGAGGHGRGDVQRRDVRPLALWRTHLQELCRHLRPRLRPHHHVQRGIQDLFHDRLAHWLRRRSGGRDQGHGQAPVPDHQRRGHPSPCTRWPPPWTATNRAWKSCAPSSSAAASSSATA